MQKIADASIILTEDCNMSCPFCYERIKSSTSMSNEMVEHAVDFLLDHQYSKRLHIMWFGGEPLLNPQTLFHGLEYVKSKFNSGNLTNLVMTNGTQWSDEIKSLVKNHPDLQIQVSWQGISELQNQERGLAELVEANIKDMIHTLPNLIHIQMQLVPSMVERIEEAVDYIYAATSISKGFIVLRPVPEVEGWTKDKLITMEEQLDKVFNKYGTKIKKILDCDRGWDAEMMFCAPGKNFCTIAPNGDIYPCHRFYFTREEQFKLGNIFDGLIDTKIADMLDGLHRYCMTGCEGCAAEKTCYICPGCNYQTTGSLTKVTKQNCRVNVAYSSAVNKFFEREIRPANSSSILQYVKDINAQEALPQIITILANLNDQMGMLSKEVVNLKRQLRYIGQTWDNNKRSDLS